MECTIFIFNIVYENTDLKNIALYGRFKKFQTKLNLYVPILCSE